MSSFRAFPGPALMRYNDFTTAEWHPVWWPARSSKPLLGGDPALGGFDSHAAPPFDLQGFLVVIPFPVWSALMIVGRLAPRLQTLVYLTT